MSFPRLFNAAESGVQFGDSLITSSISNQLCQYKIDLLLQKSDGAKTLDAALHYLVCLKRDREIDLEHKSRAVRRELVGVYGLTDVAADELMKTPNEEDPLLSITASLDKAKKIRALIASKLPIGEHATKEQIHRLYSDMTDIDILNSILPRMTVAIECIRQTQESLRHVSVSPARSLSTRML